MKVPVMTETAFDTLAAARNLEGAGIARDHAEAIAEAIRPGQGDLVTKDHLDAAMAKAERRLMIFGLSLAVALFAAIKYL